MANKKIRLLIIALLFIAPLVILAFVNIHLPLWFELPLFLFIIFFFGKDVFSNGIRSLTQLNFSDINLLMTIAVIGALYLQEFEEAAIVVILFALGNALEDFGIERSQTALKELVEKSPKTATIKNSDKETPIDEISIGSVLIIKPGDYIPLDGKVVEGSSLVDETSITGEPLPKNKQINDLVYAGTINGSGYLEVEVTKKAKDTSLARIIELTYQSAAQKLQSHRFIERFARVYTPAVVVIATLLFIVPVFLFNQPLEQWLTSSLTLLLIACPCALVISTPITVFSATGNATKRGILIKGGKYLEEMGKMKVIAFDKTRTLTKGVPKVTDIIPFEDVTVEELLACAAGIEIHSEHPLAQSIIERAEQDNIDPHTFKDFRAVTGKGVMGECLVCTDKEHCLGNLKFISENSSVEDRVIEIVEQFEQQGKTTIVMSDNNKVTGVIGISDEIREESKATVNILNKMGVSSVMLTGDNSLTAKYVADAIGIEKVYAELLPDEKVSHINDLVKEYMHVGMVGDGVNDAPSLATASVGIALGSVGSDVAVENSDIALMNNNLSHIPFLVQLGKVSVRTIRFNILLAIAVKSLFLIFAIFGRGNLTLAIIADVGVTIFVVLNSLRLYDYKGGRYEY